MRVATWIAGAVMVLLIGVFFFLIVQNTANIPLGDDLYCLLQFTQKFQDATSVSARFGLLTEQWVEHRIFFSRFAALLSWWLHGQVNFVTITLIGNAFLIGLTLLFRAQLRDMGFKNPLYLLPVALILFNPTTFEANLWAGAATVYMPVCFFGLLVPHLLGRAGRVYFPLALVVAVVATFSFGNGMFSFLSGFLMLVYMRKFRNAVIWLSVMAVAVFLYFHGLEMHSATKSFDDVGVHFRNPDYLIYNLFTFIGSVGNYIENTNHGFRAENVPAFILGILLLAAIVFGAGKLLLRRWPVVYEKSEVVWLGMAAFICITAAAMSYSRTFGESMNTVSSRYRIYSMVFLILAYLWTLMYFKNRPAVRTAWIAGSSILLVFNYFICYEHIVNYGKSLYAGVYNYKTNHDWLIYRHTAYYAPASVAVSDSISKNPKPVYHFENPFPQLDYAALAGAALIPEVGIQPLDNCFGRNGACMSMASNAFPQTSNLHEGVFVVAYNKQHIYLFPAEPVKNGRLNMLRSGDYFKSGFTALVDHENSLPKGQEYQLAVFCPSQKADPIRRIDRTLSIF